MKLFLMFFVAQMVSIGCVIGSVLLAYNGVKGWGWFLVCAIISQYLHISDDE